MVLERILEGEDVAVLMSSYGLFRTRVLSCSPPNRAFAPTRCMSKLGPNEGQRRRSTCRCSASAKGSSDLPLIKAG